METAKGEADVKLVGENSNLLASHSVFANIEEVEAFFKAGATGYSPTTRANHLQGMALHTNNWNMSPLSVQQVECHYFRNRLNLSSLKLDSVVIMRNIEHEWEALPSFRLNKGS